MTLYLKTCSPVMAYATNLPGAVRRDLPGGSLTRVGEYHAQELNESMSDS